jgi:hypothetical protein
MNGKSCYYVVSLQIAAFVLDINNFMFIGNKLQTIFWPTILSKGIDKISI